MNIDFPFHFDSRGRTAATSDDDHIRDMIEELLFTNPGERVNRPDFGSGLLQMVSLETSLRNWARGLSAPFLWFFHAIRVRTSFISCSSTPYLWA